jgi:hypothetical protein
MTLFQLLRSNEMKNDRQQSNLAYKMAAVVYLKVLLWSSPAEITQTSDRIVDKQVAISIKYFPNISLVRCCYQGAPSVMVFDYVPRTRYSCMQRTLFSGFGAFN